MDWDKSEIIMFNGEQTETQSFDSRGVKTGVNEKSWCIEYIVLKMSFLSFALSTDAFLFPIWRFQWGVWQSHTFFEWMCAGLYTALLLVLLSCEQRSQFCWELSVCRAFDWLLSWVCCLINACISALCTILCGCVCLRVAELCFTPQALILFLSEWGNPKDDKAPDKRFIFSVCFLFFEFFCHS